MISALKQKFQNGVPIQPLLREYSQSIQQLLIQAWQNNGLEREADLVLLATGGLAREELFPYSDIDLFILYQAPVSEAIKKKLNNFFDQLWGANLKPSYSIRDLAYTIHLAQLDVRVMTSLLDAKYVTGNDHLFAQLTNYLAKKPSQTENFFLSLQQYLRKMHEDFPLRAMHIKNSPGGLRSWQMLRWLGLDYLTGDIGKALNERYLYLLECRMAMHLTAGCKQDFFREQDIEKLRTLRNSLIIDRAKLVDILSEQAETIAEIL